MTSPQSAGDDKHTHYQIIPLNLRDANKFVAQFHRHNKKVQGAKFAIGLQEGDELIGVAIAGRPVARMLDNSRTIEVLRVCTKLGHKNANSQLYARVKRICQLMGYVRVITYTLKSESGSSLKAISAVPVTDVSAGGWNRQDRRRDSQAVYRDEKVRWEL